MSAEMDVTPRVGKAHVVQGAMAPLDDEGKSQRIGDSGRTGGRFGVSK
jgi:hypothetical protein